MSKSTNTAIIAATVVACVLIVAMTVLAALHADSSVITDLLDKLPGIAAASFGAYAAFKASRIDTKTDTMNQNLNGHLSNLAAKAGITDVAKDGSGDVTSA